LARDVTLRDLCMERGILEIGILLQVGIETPEFAIVEIAEEGLRPLTLEVPCLGLLDRVVEDALLDHSTLGLVVQDFPQENHMLGTDGIGVIRGRHIQGLSVVFRSFMISSNFEISGTDT
jgi:hypothetical protein